MSQLKTLETSTNLHYIDEASGSGVIPYDGMKGASEVKKMVKKGDSVGTETILDFSKESKADFEKTEGIKESDLSIVTHEMQHQYDYDQGKMTDNTGEHNAKNPAEIRAVKNENHGRATEGLAKRTTYDGEKIEPKKLE
jgi:hypothetical protein